MTLVRRDPFAGLITLRQALDRLFEEAWVSPSRFFEREAVFVPVDVAEDDQGITVKAALPGMNPEEITVNVTGTLLTITGEHKEEEEKKEQTWHRREIRYGRIERTIELPAEVDTEKAEAIFAHGMLTLRLPKAEAVKPKRIAVKAGH